MKTVLVILDVQYLFGSAGHMKKWLDLRKLLDAIKGVYIKSNETTVEIRAYLLTDKDQPSAVDRILEEEGCIISVKKVSSRPSNASTVSHDVRITMDILDRLENISGCVLVTGKSNYTDLVQRCHMYKKEVNLWGYNWSLSKQLVLAADKVFLIEELPGVLSESRVG